METTMKNQSTKSLTIVLALVLGMACVQLAPAQTFKRVKVSKNAPVTQVAAGGNSTWALANGSAYIFNGKSFVLVGSPGFTQIAVGGGNATQADEVWGLTSQGSIFRATQNGRFWNFSQVTGLLDLIQVGPGYRDNCHPYEVWGLNTAAQIYRYNYCTSQFDQQSGLLCDIHVGGGDIWGADCGPNVFRFNFTTGVFDQIFDQFSAFPQLTVGSNGDVWATDTSDSIVYKYDDDAKGFLSFGCCVTQIQAGNGVWILDGSNVYRWEPSASKFGQVGGSFVSISVGSGSGVWGINSSHQVFAFSTP
jgi:hypothetical protein